MSFNNRRDFIKKAGVSALAIAAMPGRVACSNEQVAEEHKPKTKVLPKELNKYSQKTKHLVNEATCMDMLGTYSNWYHKRNDIPLSQLWFNSPNAFTKEDFDFVMSCGINVFGWGSMKPSYESMLQFMAEQNGIIASNPNFFERIDTKEKLQNISTSNKIGMLITNQNSNHFRTLEDIDLFYGLGQRVSQLTYNGENKLGCGAFVDKDTGLTDYGKQVVERMNQVGMAVDVSHCGDKTTLEGIAASQQPVLITHGACRGIAKGVARAKTDAAIKAMAKSGGVMGIPILRFMVKAQEPVHFNDFINHIDYVAQLVGIDHVGIGSDQGLYTEDTPDKEWRKNRLENAPAKYQTHTNKDYLLTIDGLNHPYRTYDIAEGLIKKGYSDEAVKKVLGNNFQRVLMQIFKH